MKTIQTTTQGIFSQIRNTFFTLFSIFFLFTLPSFATLKYVPIMVDDIITFVPYSEVSVSLPSKKTYYQGEDAILTPTIAHTEQVKSYVWYDGNKQVSTSSRFNVKTLSVGTHTLKLIVTDKDGLSSESMMSIVIEDAPDERGHDSSSSIVGTTKGEFGVEQGSANYSLKIDVPPGVAGMEPTLSLNYHSGGGNGVLGLGWSIGGVSAITRCPQTKAVDGVNHKFGVNYNANDRFCLDGQRLIAISGSYGADGTEYRTEINNYSKIVSRGNYAGGPRYFEVQSKSGLTSIYGNTHNSYVHTHSNHALKAWKIDTITDSYHNTITFHYLQNQTLGTHILSQVTYADNTLSFIYDNRPDKLKGYHAGYPFATASRLREVIVRTGSTEVRRYKMTYSSEHTGSKRSKLISITEHVKEGDLKRLYFDWSNTTQYGLTQTDMSLPFARVVTATFGSSRIKKDKGVQLADINGDGLNDIIQLFIQKDGTSQRRICLNNGTTFECSNSYSNTIPDTYFSNSKGESMGTRLSDINGDGLLDLIQLYQPNSEYYNGDIQRHVWINNGQQFISSSYDTSLPYVYFTGEKGKDRGTRLVDINADGYVDILTLYLSSNGTSHHSVYLNNGSSFTYNSYFSSHLPGAFFANSAGEDMGTRLADMNGDGLMDIIQLYRPNHDYYNAKVQKHVWINKGNRFESSKEYDNSLYELYFTKSKGKAEGTRIADINGDGLPDLIQNYLSSTKSQYKSVYLNTGKAFLYDRSYTETLPLSYFNNSEGEDMGTRLVDMNGDGLLDIVQLYLPNHNYYNGQAQRHVYLNDGEKFTYNRNYSVSLSDTYITGEKGQDMGTQFADANGDGMIDIIQLYTPEHNYYSGIAQRRVYLNQNIYPLINKIHNNSDQSIEISYKAMTNSVVYKNYSVAGYRNKYSFNKISDGNIEVTLPQPLVYQTKVNNGLGSKSVQRYWYGGYIINKDRGSQGFHAIQMTDYTLETRTLNYYKQIGVKAYSDDTEGFAFTGMPYKVTQSHMITGKLLNETRISYKDASTRSGLYEPYTYVNKAFSYDPASGILLKTDAHYNTLSTNGYGDITQTVEEIKDALSGQTSSKTTSNSYYPVDRQTWYLGRLQSATLTHKKSNMPTLTRRASFVYNSKGLLSKEIANAGSSLALSKSYTYDNHGNKATETISGYGITTATTRYGYDSLGKFQTSVTDAGGYSISKTYNPSFGTVERLTDANGLTTRWKYDGLGRKIKETRADGTISRWGHTWIEDQDLLHAPHAHYSVSVSSDGAPFSRTYYDSLGREVGAYTYTMHKGNHSTLASRRIQTLKKYNSKGELVYEELPHYVGSPVATIKRRYDSYGRAISVEKTAAGNSTQTYTTRYSNFTQTLTNPKGIQKQTVNNAFGEVIKVTDALGKSDASTIRYSYDATGNLLSTTDSAGNVIRMEYDSVGNKIKMIDPDLGEWHYSYNALGKLRGQWSGSQGYNNAKHSSSKIYDIMGRVTRDMSYNRQEYNSNTNTYSYNQTNYTYGSAGASNGSKGKLLKTIATSRLKGAGVHAQTITSSYDRLGRVTQSSTTIAGRPTYTSKTSYDRYSRAASISYPNGYKVTHHYQNGILDSIIGSDGKVHYTINATNAFGEIADARFGNGVRTVLGYDTVGYISSIRSGRNGRYYSGDVQQLGYTYDSLGNVVIRHDDSISNKSISETFTYDNHNRLYSLRTSSDVVGAYIKNKDYRYDKLGNITYQTGIGSYTYYPDKPHALKSAGSRSYTYDAVGNMTHRNGDTITYNPLNKPATLTNHTNNKTVTFTYGAGGQRYMKQTSDGKYTYYLGKAYEEQVSDNHTKQIAYITLGGKTIGEHVEVKDTDYVTTNAHYNEATYNRYFHTDALGSITSITNDSGTVVERRSYDPLGKIRAMNYGTNNNSIANTTIQTTKAFTGHEQIAELSGLIHMNARVYDSDIGRFLSADTLIQDPHDSQSYNRYSYVRNNPLKYSDPTGHSWFSKTWDKIGTYVIAVVVAVVAVYTGGLALSAMGYGSVGAAINAGAYGAIAVSGAVGGFAAGVTGGLLGGANLGDSIAMGMQGAAYGAIGAVTAGYIGGIAQGFQGGKVIRAALHGITRAAISKAQGSTWHAGFWSGFASSALAPLAQGAGTTEAKVAMSAIVGGTASELGGGKFANGAVTGAFVMMYNELGHSYKTNVPTPAEIRQLEAFQRNDSGLIDVSLSFVPIERLFVAIGNTFKAAFQYVGLAPYSGKIITQMKKGEWTNEKVFEALKTNGIEATGKLNSATRYVHPDTGKSIIIDNVTKELFHAGRKADFKY